MTLRLDPLSVVVGGCLEFRVPLSFADRAFASLKQSIAHTAGNVQPIKVRSADEARWELVFGARRLRACLELGLPVAAVAEDLTALAAFTQLDASNDDSHVSVYERGRLYRAALDSGYFPSSRRLAQAVGRALSDVQQALATVELSSDVVKHLKDPRALTPATARRLAAAVSVDPDAATARMASLTGKQLMTGRELLQLLQPHSARISRG